GTWLIFFYKHVVPDNRRCRPGGHTVGLGNGDLVFDLHVVADSIPDQIVLNQPIYKRLRAVRFTQVESRSRANDVIRADNPAPGRCLRGNTISLLAAILADQYVTLHADVMSQVFLVTSGANSECARNATAVNPQILDR